MKTYLWLLLIGLPFLLPAQSDLSVMTFNIRFDNPSDGDNSWDKRKEHVAHIIRLYHVDVCGMQEALRHQVQDLDTLLSDFDWVGTGRDSAGTGEYACIFYRRSTMSLLQSSTFWLNEHPERIGPGWDARLNRIVTWACFRQLVTGDTVFVFNTHFDHQGRTARRESARLLAQKIALIAGGQTSIVTGDFNAVPSDEPLQILFSTPGIQDTRALSEMSHFGPLGTFNGFKQAESSDEPIDYILLRHTKYRVLKHATLSHTWQGRFASDHHPVWVLLRE